MDQEIDIKRKKGIRNTGLCFLIPGVLFIFWGLLSWLTQEYTETGYTPEAMMVIIIYGMVPGIILLVIGFALIMYYRKKLP